MIIISIATHRIVCSFVIVFIDDNYSLDCSIVMLQHVSI